MNEISIRPMTIADYEEALALWQGSEGVGLSAADSREAIAAYLQRNPDLSMVAFVGTSLVGAVLCGHDGRRGFIHHLAVAPAYRRRGIGSALVRSCLARLRALGIGKCHLFVFHANESAQAFWRAQGWHVRHDILIMSRYIDE